LIGSAVFAQLTAEGRCTLQQAAPFPLKIALPMGDSDPPHVIHGSLGPYKSKS